MEATTFENIMRIIFAGTYILLFCFLILVMVFGTYHMVKETLKKEDK